MVALIVLYFGAVCADFCAVCTLCAFSYFLRLSIKLSGCLLGNSCSFRLQYVFIV